LGAGADDKAAPLNRNSETILDRVQPFPYQPETDRRIPENSQQMDGERSGAEGARLKAVLDAVLIRSGSGPRIDFPALSFSDQDPQPIGGVEIHAVLAFFPVD
jgi:hypothetical protein